MIIQTLTVVMKSIITTIEEELWGEYTTEALGIEDLGSIVGEVEGECVSQVVAVVAQVVAVIVQVVAVVVQVVAVVVQVVAVVVQVVAVVVQVAEEDHAESQKVFEWITIGKEFQNSQIVSGRKGSSEFLKMFL
jgi:hypothetical protein